MERTLVAPISFGLGDLVLSLPVVAALVEQGSPVWLVARAPSQVMLAERIPGLCGVVGEEGLVLRPGDRFVDLRDHPLQRDFWWGSPAFEAAHGTLGINEILARICADFGIAADFSRPVALRADRRLDLDRTVLLVHESDGPAKYWPVDRWAEVVSALLPFVTQADAQAGPVSSVKLPPMARAAVTQSTTNLASALTRVEDVPRRRIWKKRLTAAGLIAVALASGVAIAAVAASH